jgi:hypothetical protein
MYMQIDFASRTLAHIMRRRENKRIGPILAMPYDTSTSGTTTEISLGAFSFLEHPRKVLSIAESDRWAIPSKATKTRERSIGVLLEKPQVSRHVNDCGFTKKRKDEKRIRHEVLKKP